MPTSKRKMNRKRWKQPKITGKRSNDRLGLNSKEQNSIEFYKKCGFSLSEVGKTRNENMERDGDLPLTVRMYKRILPAKE